MRHQTQRRDLSAGLEASQLTGEATVGQPVTDRQPIRVDYPHKELVSRLLADTCEICQQTGDVQVHHVRKLADLGAPGPLQPLWAKAMANRRRKTLVVCASCHDHIRTGQPATPLTQ